MKIFLSRENRGFSLIELIIAILLLGLVMSSIFFLLRSQLLGTLETEADLLKFALLDAQLRAITGQGGKAWGVRFDNATTSPYYAIFPGTSFSSASSTSFLSEQVRFCLPASGTTTDIVFEKLTGRLSAGTTTLLRIELKNDSGHLTQKQILITPRGAVNITTVSTGACS